MDCMNTWGRFLQPVWSLKSCIAHLHFYFQSFTSVWFAAHFQHHTSIFSSHTILTQLLPKLLSLSLRKTEPAKISYWLPSVIAWEKMCPSSFLSKSTNRENLPRTHEIIPWPQFHVNKTACCSQQLWALYWLLLDGELQLLKWTVSLGNKTLCIGLKESL